MSPIKYFSIAVLFPSLSMFGGCGDKGGPVEVPAQLVNNVQKAQAAVDAKIPIPIAAKTDPSPTAPNWKRVRQESLLSEYVDADSILVEGDRVGAWTLFDLNQIHTHKSSGVDYYSHKEFRSFICAEKTAKTLVSILYEKRMAKGDFEILDIKPEWKQYGDHDVAMAFVCAAIKK